jgi:hypothetical protein
MLELFSLCSNLEGEKEIKKQRGLDKRGGGGGRNLFISHLKYIRTA